MRGNASFKDLPKTPICQKTTSRKIHWKITPMPLEKDPMGKARQRQA